MKKSLLYRLFGLGKFYAPDRAALESEGMQKGGKFAYVFETDGKRVTNFRAGKFPEVEYIEGCS